MPLNLTALEDAIASQHERQPFSGVISVRQGGQTVFARAYGYANLAEQVPNTVETRFGIASGGKTFTSVAVCQLVERGLATFDTPLRDCTGGLLPRFDPGVTLHHLLTHSSGIPDYFDESVQDDYEALWRERPMYSFRRPADFLPLFADMPMQFKPGERWAYNNSGFIVLGLVVEHLSGMPFADYIEKNIFQPCGMNASGYFALDQLPGGTALGYIATGDGGWRTNIYAIPVIGGGDGGAFTSAPDLARFWDALLGYKLLSQPTVAQMLTPHWRMPDREDTHYGYGLWLKQRPGDSLAYYMLGGDPGVVFYSGCYPAAGVQFTLLANTEEPASPMFECIAPLLRLA